VLIAGKKKRKKALAALAQPISLHHLGQPTTAGLSSGQPAISDQLAQLVIPQLTPPVNNQLASPQLARTSQLTPPVSNQLPSVLRVPSPFPVTPIRHLPVPKVHSQLPVVTLHQRLVPRKPNVIVRQSL